MTIIDQLVLDCEARIQEIKAEEAKWEGVESEQASEERMYWMGKRHEASRTHMALLSAQLKERLYGYAGVA